MGKVIRTKTKYTNIYFNEDTKKYDIKYNYKVYNTVTQKNDYKSKWKYNINTITEAKQELSLLQSQGIKNQDKDITISGIFELWKKQAEATGKSEVTIRNTTQQYNMLTQFISKDYKLKDIDDDVYYDLFVKIKKNGYSQETIHSLNSCFRKLINLAYKKRLITENPLHRAENVKTKKKNSEEYRIITHEEFKKLDKHLKETKFIRLGINRYDEFRLIYNLLYYSGVRIGEALALTYKDFKLFDYYKNDDNKPIRIAPSDVTQNKHMEGMKIIVNKSYISDMKIIKDPKNKKNREIPIPSDLERLFLIYKNKYMKNEDERIFKCEYGTYLDIITKSCKKCNLEHINLHAFRHTYITNLIRKGVPLPVVEKVSGDTQETILKTYSHLFEDDIFKVLDVMEHLNN